MPTRAARCRVQGRVVEVFGRIGAFFAALKLDDLRGRTDEAATVALRAAQLRCASLTPSPERAHVFANVHASSRWQLEHGTQKM